MTSTLKSAAQELRELYGADADRICLRSAENDGMPDKAKDWRELAAEAVRLCLPKQGADLGAYRFPDLIADEIAV